MRISCCQSIGNTTMSNGNAYTNIIPLIIKLRKQIILEMNYLMYGRIERKNSIRDNDAKSNPYSLPAWAVFCF